MRNAVGAFGLVCGAIVIWTVANYGYGSSDDPSVKWNMAFLFGAVACGGLFGHAVAARMWRTSKAISIVIGVICGVALVVNLSNSLAALAGRADRSSIERVALNKRIRADEAELARLQRQREAMPAFLSTDRAAVMATMRAADTASDNRKAECGNGDPKQRGPNCRQREIEEKDAAERLASATSAKAATEKAADYEAAMAGMRQRLAAAGPVVTVNVQGSALARLFRLPDSEATFAETVQQFGMATIVELLIAFALVAWEVLRQSHGRPENASTINNPSSEKSKQLDLIVHPVLKAPPRPKLVSNKPPAGSVSDYVVARLEAAKSAELEFAQAYEDYATWCRRRAIDHLDSELFAEAMKRICAKTRIRIKAKSGTAVFEGVRLSEAVPSAQAT